MDEYKIVSTHGYVLGYVYISADTLFEFHKRYSLVESMSEMFHETVILYNTQKEEVDY